MTTKELAQELDGSQYGTGFTPGIEIEAVKSGLVVCYYTADDSLEMRGALHLTLPISEHSGIYFNKDLSVIVDEQGYVFFASREVTNDEIDLISEEGECLFLRRDVVHVGNKIEIHTSLYTSVEYAKFPYIMEGVPNTFGLVLSLTN
jgi:hypothetical protein